MPLQEDAASKRAYLSNVCVAAAARRSGVASGLMQAAESAASSSGVEHLYVHVVADNAPAKRLYERLGFAVEAEESEGYARSLSRPRRLILHKRLGG
jgi:ribosomal protein S18 acetylase RimI-like enzyme